MFSSVADLAVLAAFTGKFCGMYQTSRPFWQMDCFHSNRGSNGSSNCKGSAVEVCFWLIKVASG